MHSKYIVWAIYLHVTGGGYSIADLHAKCISYNYSTYYEVRIVSLGWTWLHFLKVVAIRDKYCFVRQFVVTSCKEWPGSIVNETLKNGILMLKYTSKESDFHADFKYISFIKFSVCHQKLRAWENLPYFGK